MEHWIEPQELAGAHNGPRVDVQNAQAPQQQMLAAQQQLAMRPGVVSRVLNTAQRFLPGILVGAALVAVVLPWFGVTVAMEPRKRG